MSAKIDSDTQSETSEEFVLGADAGPLGEHVLEKKTDSPDAPSSSEGGEEERRFGASGDGQSGKDPQGYIQEDFGHADRDPQGALASRRRRNSLTPYQTKILQRVLDQTAFPTKTLREQLAKMLNLSTRSVQIWFQNQRQKARTRLASIRGAESPVTITRSELAESWRQLQIPGPLARPFASPTSSHSHRAENRHSTSTLDNCGQSQGQSPFWYHKTAASPHGTPVESLSEWPRREPIELGALLQATAINPRRELGQIISSHGFQRHSLDRNMPRSNGGSLTTSPRLESLPPISRWHKQQSYGVYGHDTRIPAQFYHPGQPLLHEGAGPRTTALPW